MPLLRFICKERLIFQILGPSQHNVGDYGRSNFVGGAENEADPLSRTDVMPWVV